MNALILVRWATGKRLTNRLPKLSLTSITYIYILDTTLDIRLFSVIENERKSDFRQEKNPPQHRYSFIVTLMLNEKMGESAEET